MGEDMILLNLCELSNHRIGERNLFKDGFIESVEESNGFPISRDRVYLGSYFCSQLFLSTDWNHLLKVCSTLFGNVTLCVPIFSEKDIDAGKKLIQEIISEFPELIDEVSINDFGMLRFFKDFFPGIKVHLGRLLFKHPRDIRIPRYEEETLNFSSADYKDYKQRYGVSGFEIDRTNKHICFENSDDTKDYILSLHAPFSYMTTGNICKYASIQKPIHLKFRPNLRCEKECSHMLEYYRLPEKPDCLLYRLGRTIYFSSVEYKEEINKVDRLLYFPAFELYAECRGEK